MCFKWFLKLPWARGGMCPPESKWEISAFQILLQTLSCMPRWEPVDRIQNLYGLWVWPTCLSLRADKSWKSAGWGRGVYIMTEEGRPGDPPCFTWSCFPPRRGGSSFIYSSILQTLWVHLSCITLVRGQACEDTSVRKMGIRVCILESDWSAYHT